MLSKDWNINDVYESVGGKMQARILLWTTDGVAMERWNVNKNGERGRGRFRFVLSEKFALSNRCGWKKRRRTQ